MPTLNLGAFAACVNGHARSFPGLGDSGGQPALNHPQAPQLAGKVFNEVLVEFLRE